MLKLLAKLFGAKDAAPAQPEAPYKVEAPAPVVKEEAPAPVAEAPAKKPRAKKPAAPKKAGGRKPKSKA